jgi:hypothetical protein
MSHPLWYIRHMIMNEDEKLNALLDAVCEGVELPTEEQEQETLDNQSS